MRRAVLDGEVTPVESLLLRSAMSEARVVTDAAGNSKLAKQSLREVEDSGPEMMRLLLRSWRYRRVVESSKSLQAAAWSWSREAHT